MEVNLSEPNSNYSISKGYIHTHTHTPPEHMHPFSLIYTQGTTLLLHKTEKLIKA